MVAHTGFEFPPTRHNQPILFTLSHFPYLESPIVSPSVTPRYSPSLAFGRQMDDKMAAKTCRAPFPCGCQRGCQMGCHRESRLCWAGRVSTGNGSSRAWSYPRHRLAGRRRTPVRLAREPRSLPHRVSPAVYTLNDRDGLSHVNDWVKLESEKRSPGRGGFGQGLD